MEMKNVNNVTIRDLTSRQIRFRNMEGRKEKFNDKGQRSFHIVLDPEFAKVLEADGWNIRWREPREEGDEPTPTIQVFARYDFMPPKIWIVTKNKKTLLDENTLKAFDWAEIEKLSITIRPYQYEFNGRYGIKAYVKTMYVTIVEDELDEEYYDFPDGTEDVPFE